MTSYTNTVTIGVQGVSSGPVTVIQSAQTIAARGLFMKGQVLRYVYTIVMCAFYAS